MLRSFHIGIVVRNTYVVYFSLLDTNGFQVKAKNERFTTAGSGSR